MQNIYLSILLFFTTLGTASAAPETIIITGSVTGVTGSASTLASFSVGQTYTSTITLDFATMQNTVTNNLNGNPSHYTLSWNTFIQNTCCVMSSFKTATGTFVANDRSASVNYTIDPTQKSPLNFTVTDQPGTGPKGNSGFIGYQLYNVDANNNAWIASTDLTGNITDRNPGAYASNSNLFLGYAFGDISGNISSIQFYQGEYSAVPLPPAIWLFASQLLGMTVIFGKKRVSKAH